ncbi:polysaccharide export outer membrane protein [Dokdonia sp. Hel_I_63]|uniref:polysaccharide biosynthesis/export family protein n=1 Tax=unclassified Dokdonia TaxID=2615033 RepID=UPI00020A6C1B|nr:MULTISPECIES: polysaccharide biosynthesis/export family protein [unclassified Dokdonia]AEE20732.1 Soluble ligand binding domain protein [Dokdonia sp. 4H-3-7-5]TVZ23012.1 polysaccharide export outer membrane protein [Dokdonia sp. Hel_I_63]
MLLDSISFRFLVVVLIAFFFSSCVSKKDVLYFQDVENISSKDNSNDYEVIVRPNDLLTIYVSALSPEAVLPFNPMFTSSGISRNGDERLQTYLVDNKGNIDFPLIGSLAIGGKTKQKVIELIQERISTYVKNPIVNLNIINYTISVLGEVARPGSFTISDERITILEALGRAGDMTLFGDRKTVTIIREQDNRKIYGQLDFTSIDAINSPYYYLNQNDVVIVSPNKAQVQSSGFNRNSSIFISIAGIIISVIAVLVK